MAYANKTIDDIYTLIVSSLDSEFNTKFRLLPKSFVRIISKVFAGVYITLYKELGWFFLQMFVDTATFDTVEVLGKRIRPLVKWGELVGIGAPGAATYWEGKASAVVVSAGNYVESGRQLKSLLTNKIYIVKTSVLISGTAGAKIALDLSCTTSGTAGNLVADDTLQLVNPLDGIEKTVTVTSVTTTATDSETETTYRERVKLRWRTQPQGGALSDYRKWSSEVSGVYQTFIYSDTESSSGVIIYVEPDPDTYADRVAPSDMLIAVGKACTYDSTTGEATRKPIGAVLDPSADGTYTNIKPCSITGFKVNITGASGDELASFSSSAKSNLTSYFNEREPFIRGLSVDNNRLDKITLNNLLGIINEIAIDKQVDFTTAEMSKKDGTAVTEYTLGKGELASLLEFSVNGTVI